MVSTWTGGDFARGEAGRRGGVLSTLGELAAMAEILEGPKAGIWLFAGIASLRLWGG